MATSLAIECQAWLLPCRAQAADRVTPRQLMMQFDSVLYIGRSLGVFRGFVGVY